MWRLLPGVTVESGSAVLSLIWAELVWLLTRKHTVWCETVDSSFDVLQQKHKGKKEKKMESCFCFWTIVTSSRLTFCQANPPAVAATRGFPWIQLTPIHWKMNTSSKEANESTNHCCLGSFFFRSPGLPRVFFFSIDSTASCMQIKLPIQLTARHTWCFSSWHCEKQESTTLDVTLTPWKTFSSLLHQLNSLLILKKTKNKTV